MHCKELSNGNKIIKMTIVSSMYFIMILDRYILYIDIVYVSVCVVVYGIGVHRIVDTCIVIHIGSAVKQGE